MLRPQHVDGRSCRRKAERADSASNCLAVLTVYQSRSHVYNGLVHRCSPFEGQAAAEQGRDTSLNQDAEPQCSVRRQALLERKIQPPK